MKKQLNHYHHLFYALLSILFLNSNKAVACSGQDVIFTNISITSISTGNYQYNYTIKNIGTTNITLNQVSIQNYVSTDNQVGGDGAAGGSVITGSGNPDVLAPGATYTGSYAAYPFPANPISSHPYLIAVLSINPGPECDASNNTLVKLIQVETGIKSSKIADASVNWDAETKKFSVESWSGNSNTLEYKLYSSSGILVSSGNSKKNESTPLNHLNKGVYVLYLSDGEKIYSKKIAY